MKGVVKMLRMIIEFDDDNAAYREEKDGVKHEIKRCLDEIGKQIVDGSTFDNLVRYGRVMDVNGNESAVWDFEDYNDPDYEDDYDEDEIEDRD